MSGVIRFAILVFIIDIVISVEAGMYSVMQITRDAMISVIYWSVLYICITKCMRKITWNYIRMITVIFFVSGFLGGIYIFDFTVGNLMIESIKVQEYVIFLAIIIYICAKSAAQNPKN